MGESEHPTNWLSVCEFQYRDTLSSRHESLPSRYRLDWDSSKRTTVGSDVWIGDSAIIKKGIELATGTIIGAGSVVTKSTDPYSIVVGNPAKPIRQRFEDTIIERLLKSEWWDHLDLEELKGIPFNDINKAIGDLERKIDEKLAVN